MKGGPREKGDVMGEGNGLRPKKECVRRKGRRFEMRAIEDEKVRGYKIVMSKPPKLSRKDAVGDGV